MDFLSLFQTNGFIISIGVTLLLVGVVVYYFRNKIKYLEHSHMEQAKVLQSFIQKMSLENHPSVVNYDTPDANSLANNTVIDKANMYIDNQYTDKINISEHESDSDSDSDSDSESDSDSDSDNEQNIEQNNVVKDVVEQVVLEQEPNVKKIVIENNDNNVSDTKEDKLEPIVLNISKAEGENTSIENVSDSESESESDSDSDTEMVDLNNQETQHNEPLVVETSQDESQDEPQDESQKEEKKIVKKENSRYSKMKVTALRDLALENKLVENEDDAKKKKKKELIELLSSAM